MHLFGRVLTSNFPHCVSVLAAFTPRYATLSEFMIFSLADSPLPITISPSLPLSPFLPSRFHLITSLFPKNAFVSPLLRLSRSMCPEINAASLTNSPSFPLGSDTVFCHPIKALIYCISQIGILVIYTLLLSSSSS